MLKIRRLIRGEKWPVLLCSVGLRDLLDLGAICCLRGTIIIFWRIFPRTDVRDIGRYIGMWIQNSMESTNGLNGAWNYERFRRNTQIQWVESIECRIWRGGIPKRDERLAIGVVESSVT